MSCPECGSVTEVVDSRAAGAMVRRRRVCPCGHRFTTYEVVASGKTAEHVDEVDQAASAALDAVEALMRAVERLTPVIPRVSRDARRGLKAS